MYYLRANYGRIMVTLVSSNVYFASILQVWPPGNLLRPKGHADLISIGNYGNCPV